MTQTAGLARPTQIQRNKLALFASALTACAAVSAVGFLSVFLLTLVTQDDGISKNDFLAGMQMASQISAVNFFLFFINIPAAFVGLAVTLGRKPYALKVEPLGYYREAAIVGAVLVGGICSLIGLAQSALGAFGGMFWGGMIGAASGCCCAGVYRLIVRPDRQINHVDPEIFS